MLSAIVFDFDGVIADSEPVHFRSFRDVLADEGVDLSERDYYQKYLGFSDAGAFRAIGADRARPWTADQLAALASRKAIRYEALARDHATLFPGADAAVRRAADVVPLAIASGALRAEITDVLDRAAMIMPTSTGGQREMRRVGALEFTLKGQTLKLTAFVEANAPNVDHLFVPFTDLTSGTETYPAGRYLDLDRNATGLYAIDFNRAYHPFCYYNPTYDCPYPPAENRLKIPIRAGERVKNSKLETQN